MPVTFRNNLEDGFEFRVSTFAKFAANVDLRPPAPINASTTSIQNVMRSEPCMARG
jgi:hypothetical protein